MKRLVIGGARSGKSSFAESLMGDRVDYVATAARRADDPEWDARIAAHRDRRPASWRTIETLDLAAVLDEGGEADVLVDCLTVWLTRTMDGCGCWDGAPGSDAALQAACDAVVAAVGRTSRNVVFVTNEVGQGIVPVTSSGRLFRDQMGIFNARVAAACDEVWLVTAGIPVRIKG